MANDHLKEWNAIIAAGDAAKHKAQSAPSERIAALEKGYADLQKVAVALHARLEVLEAAALREKPEPPPE
jgi:hypothetical protein